MQSFDGGIALGSLNRKNTRTQEVLRFAPPVVRLPVSCRRAEVKKGDKVKIGQLIAHGAVNSFATVAGTIESVDEKYITIKNDFTEKTVEHDVINESDFDKLDGKHLLSLLKNYSILGMGGAEFPAHRKYSTDKNIDAIVINGCECEPYLTCDYVLMRDNFEAVILGARLFQKIVNAKKIILCIEEHSRDIIDNFSSIEVMVFPDKYPQGSEKMIAVSGFDTEIPYGGFPEDCGIIVSNVSTCAAFATAVLSGLPPVKRLVTVDGNVQKPCNVEAPFGTPAGALLDACGGLTDGSGIILGGPMTGKRITDLSVPVTYGTNGVLALSPEDIKETPCIRCGGCMRVCPSGLTPFRIEEEYLAGRYSVCKQLRAEQCISCGCCSFICPAKRELAYNVTRAKERGRRN